MTTGRSASSKPWVAAADCPRSDLHGPAVYGSRYSERYSSDGGTWAYIDGVKAMTHHHQSLCPGCDLYRIWTPKAGHKP